MEFVKMTRTEFRAGLYEAYIKSGFQDPALIQGYISIAETFVFDQKKHSEKKQPKKSKWRLNKAILKTSKKDKNQENGSNALKG